MSMSYDGSSSCAKCDSHSISYDEEGKSYCEYCGTYQVKYYKEQMISNLIRYGFKEVKVFETPSFYEKMFNISPKQLKSYYKYGSIIAKHIEGQSNMIFVLGLNDIITFNNYGEFKYVKKSIDNILNTKKIQRRLKLEQLKNHIYE